ncbi:zinc finger BED domain-containing protein RICESLEEPER 2-like [Solanum stenotomum]|uniref:zinc finger BED domain-containing protein RICESLEEPER 2-like n=1 Tax=Solanum stenotomum TaxID=172797 RepID=UPI0020D13548|nr:zinc finger BED domain-containing protein RICESLEEPER 2-like [Solanum stenotomum]
MTEIESKISESGTSNDTIHNTSSPNEVEVDIEASKKRKAMEPRAACWKHFEKFIDKDGATKAKCNYCGKTYAAATKGNGTSAMNNHMTKKKCPNFPSTQDYGQKLINFLPSSTGEKEGVISTWKFDQAQSRRALAQMIIVDELPFSIVEKEGFRNIMKVVVPQFHIPSRRTLTRDCYELYSEEKKLLKKSFKEARPKVCLTTNTWTSIQRINYLCLTAHFIDRNWTLHKRIRKFCPISSHKGDEMAASITNCLLDWGLDNVFTITVDNASSNSVTVKEISKQLTNWGTNIMEGQHLHVRCMAHILNLIVQDGLKEVGQSVKRVRQAVKYIRQSPARIKKFKECCESKLITCKKSLCLDVPTRWNSTYLMFDTTQHFELAFERYCFYDNGFLDYLHTHDCEDGTKAGVLTSVDWENVRSMIKFLETFYTLTLKVSGSKYVTNNVHFVEIVELDLILKEMTENEDSNLKKMAESMRDKFRKYWGELDNMNKMIFTSAVLDPRNKLDYVHFAIGDMFGKTIGEPLVDAVDKYMKALFDHYVKKSSKVSLFSSSPPTSSGNSSSISNVSDDDNFQKRGSMRTKLEFVRHKVVSGSSSSKSELGRYLAEDVEPETDDFDILKWWKFNEPRFPILSEMARDVLVIPISSVASECAFSTGGRILDPFRSSLTPKLVQALISLQDWYRSEPIPINVEEDLEYLELLELDMAHSGIESIIVDV